jgi:hypothetical protein
MAKALGTRRKIPPTKKNPMVGYHGITVEEVKVIDELLMSGKTPHFVSKYIREKMNRATTVSSIAVLMKVKGYRDDHLSKKIVLAASLIEEDKKAELVTQLVDDLDVLREISELCLTQKMRVVHLITQEKNKQDTLPFTASNIRLLGELLVQAANLQMELGVIKRKPKKIEADINFNSEDRKKVFESMQFYDGTSEATAEVLRLIANNDPTVVPMEVEDAQLSERG